jgi:NitT/TauT family transport system substrate-binding protein
MIRRHALGALAATALFVPAALPSRADDLVPFAAGTPPSDGVKALLYAQHAGLFRKYGLDLTIVPMSSGSAALAGVIGGSLQVAFVNTTSVINAYSRGVRFTFVAPGGIYQTERPYALMFTRKDAPFVTGRDLDGHTIASLALKDQSWLASIAWIEANGGDPKTIRSVEMPASSYLPALDESRIDAVTLLSPFMDQALASGKYKVLGKSFDAIAKHFQISGWAASSDATAKDPDPYLRFGRAMHEAILYSNAHLADTVDLVAQYTKIDPQVIAHGTRVLDAEYLTPENLQPMVEVSLKYGLIDRSFDAGELIFASARPPAR